MAFLPKSKRLKKELSLLNVYAIATGATISSGFFLLPGLAAAQAGPAVILSYLVAAIPLIPAVFSMAELATAMPRAGGVYYFLDRSMGPLMGTIGGLGTWLALVLKTAFALIGMGAYVGLFFPQIPIVPLAALFAILFGLVNLFGARKSGYFQLGLVFGLLFILMIFMISGLFNIKVGHFHNFFNKGLNNLFATAGLVYVSYVGLTKIASISEEVHDPEKNIPLGMLLALLTALLIYGIGTLVMVGVLPAEKLYNDLTPVASTAQAILGKSGAVIMTVAAVLAFFSVANAGILSASRYPLAMSRDHLVPRFFRFLSKHRTPKVAIYTTVGLILLFIILFDPTKIAKLASAFQLLLFALSCLAVIIMRESKIESYDPGYRSPFYPWTQLFGILAAFWLISEMGWWPTLFMLGLITIGTIWYFAYARDRVVRGGAIYHIFARLGERRFEGLDRELRGILIEKGVREQDPYDMVVAKAQFIDIPNKIKFENVVARAAAILAKRLEVKKEVLVESFLQGTRVGATPVSHGIALPHLRLPDLHQPELVMVRTRQGVRVEVDPEFLGSHAPEQPVFAFFFLVSPEDDPKQHLRILAQIAGHADDKKFLKKWRTIKNEYHLKELLLRDERFLTLRIEPDSKTAEFIDRNIRDLNLPKGTLVAMIHRDGNIIFPRGRTRLRKGDRLTIIGEPKDIQDLMQRFED